MRTTLHTNSTINWSKVVRKMKEKDGRAYARDRERDSSSINSGDAGTIPMVTSMEKMLKRVGRKVIG